MKSKKGVLLRFSLISLSLVLICFINPAYSTIPGSDDSDPEARKPSIIERLVEVEKARLKGLDTSKAYEEEGVLYKGADFKVTEEIYEKVGLNIRALTMTSDTGEALSEQKMVEDEIIVSLNSYEDAKATTADGALSIARSPAGGEGSYKMKIEDSRRIEEVLASIEIEGMTRFAEPNGIIVGEFGRVAAPPNDPEFWSQWGLHNTAQELPVSEGYDVPRGIADVDIDAPEAWDTFKGEKNTIVAILDTGCDYNHPDLYPNIWKNLGEIPGNNFDDDGNGYIDDIRGWNFREDNNDPIDYPYKYYYGHSTHVAGIIGASGDNEQGMSGIMHNTNLMILKMLALHQWKGEWYWYGTMDGAAQGIRYAVNKGAKVINISWWTTEKSQELEEAIKEAEKAGVIVVCLSGGGGRDIDEDPAYPASFTMDNIITVCAIDATDRVASFSNTGKLSVDLGAPGVQILSANAYWEKSGQEDYRWSEWGTSGPAFVSGAAGLLRSLVPTATAGEIKEALLDSAFKTPSLEGKCVTGGRLNLNDAIGKLTEGTMIYVEKAEADEDGIMSPGETVRLDITLRNVGKEHALGIKATLSVDNENIFIQKSTKDYGDIPSGTQVKKTYTLNIDDGLSTPNPATFTVAIEDKNEERSEREFFYPIYRISSISGKVLDYITRNPLEGATVLLEATYDYEGPYFGETKTDGGGNYAFQNLKDGKYRLKAKYPDMLDSDWLELTLSPDARDADFLMGQSAKIECTPANLELDVPVGMRLQKMFFIKNVGAPDLTYRLYPGARWLRGSPYRGQIKPDKTQNILLTFDARYLTPFTDHETELEIRTNEKDNETVKIPVLMHAVYGPGLKYYSHTTDDDKDGNSDGDADTYPEPGETVEMKITLINEGAEQADAKGVTARLSTDDSYITIIDDYDEFGDIPGKRKRGTSIDYYVFSISPDTPNGHEAWLKLDIIDNAGHSWKSHIFLTIKESYVVSGTVIDEKTGLAISGARVTATGLITRRGTTASDGTYSVFGLFDGGYSLMATHGYYSPSESTRIAVPPDVSGIDFSLNRPVMGVDPTRFEKDVPKDGEAHQMLTISNSGNEPLNFSTKVFASTIGAGSASVGSLPGLTNGELVRKMLALKDRSRKGLDPELAEKMNRNPGKTFNVLIEVMDTPFYAENLANLANAGDAERIIRFLQANSAVSQAEVNSRLNSFNTIGSGMTYRSFWIANVINVRNAPKHVIEAIAQKSEVRVVYEEGFVQLDPPPPELVGAGTQASTEWNISRVRAHLAWAAGIDGTGVVVGNIDTGVQADHPDLAGKIRPENAWFDSVEGKENPYDDHGHGTHTIGTMVGGNTSGKYIGVAPGAQFLSAKGLNSQGRGQWGDMIACGQWMIDPDNNPSTDDAPCVVSNSWSTSVGSSTTYWDTVTAWVAAGIAPVFSNGNRGPKERSVGAPASYPHSIGVGATMTNNRIADFSSRGPSPFDDEIKPNISAPGVSIKSSYPPSRYREWQGTSMAAPHVAGTVALINQVNPDISVDEARRSIEESASDLGDPGKDNTYGAGLLNAYDAIRSAASKWLSVEPKEGTVGPDQEEKVRLIYNATGLEKKTYKAELFVLSNDPGRRSVKIPITMNVIGGPSIIYNAYVLDDDMVDDSSGDDDGHPEAGETIEMKVTLKNTGTDAAHATGVKALLRTDSPYITITDDYEEFGDMPQGSSATCMEDYDFSISSGAPEEHLVTFILDVEDADTRTWENFFTITIRNASKVEGRVTDAKTGSGIEGAKIKAIGIVEKEVPTDPDGNYTLTGLFNGPYTVSCKSSSYLTPEEQLVVVPPSVQDFDFVMVRPEAVITPESLRETVPEGGKAYRNLLVKNEGSADLEFVFSELPQTGSSSSALSDKELVSQMLKAKDRSYIGITDSLRLKMDSAAPGEMIRAIVEFKDIADIVRHVGDAPNLIADLKETARASQKELKPYLEKLKSDGAIKDFHAFWISNIISVEAPPEVIKEIEKFEGVREIRPDEIVYLSDPVETEAIETQDSYEWNVSKVRAPEVWALGITGQGVLVGSIDTGIEADHPDLIGKIRPENNFYDPYNGKKEPYDDMGHGTHTMGTTLGGNESGKWIGLAPDATYIMAKGFNSYGYGYFPEIHQCMQWILDPDGNPDTNDYPSVCNNSWGGGGTNKELWDDVTAWVAAGIFPAFSIGNGGPGKSSTGFPGNYPHSFGVGATDSKDEIASFSSRGPVSYDGKEYIKPDISAPGVSVNSAFPGKGYKVWQGTSMACPHITGVVALMRAVNPAMSIDRIRKAIEETSLDLGEEGKDNTYGAGRLDCFEAFKRAGVLWLDEKPRSGNLAPGTEENILVTFDASNQAQGEYKVDLVAFMNDPVNPSMTIPVTMTVGTGPYISYVSHEIDDDQADESSGDNDGFVEPGETIEMKLTLINTGKASADTTGVTATLTTEDSYITIIDDYEEFGDMASGGSTVSPDDYDFSVANDVPDGHVIKFTIHIADSKGNAWMESFEETVKYTYNVSGKVTDRKTGDPVESAIVKAIGPVEREAATDVNGDYEVIGLFNGEYEVYCEKSDYNTTDSQTVTVPPHTTNIDFALDRPIAAVDPTSLYMKLPKDAKNTKYLTIKNEGTVDLEYLLGAIRKDSGSSALTNGELVAKMLAAKDRSRKGLDPALREKMEANPAGTFNVLVEMMQETKGLPEMADRRDREGIIRALQATANASQAGLKAMLSNALANNGNITYRAFWIGNVISIRNAPKRLVEEVARLEEVREVYEEGTVQLAPPPETTKQPPVGNLEWNIHRVKADKAWEIGIDGTGVLIGSIDTGVQADHPDLAGKIRAEHSWFDPVYKQKSPRDVHGHGTHTIGTMVGGDADGTHIGVAPGATYIAANGFNYWGSGSDADLIACGQWMMDPDNNPSTDDAPSVICNSWGGSGGNKFYWNTVTAWIASGIFPEFSAGNEGPSSGSLRSPGDYPHSFATGATTPTDSIASFSSRGPSKFGGIIKPDISAPGTEIKSSFKDGKYKEWQGTSMAGPHVAATAALMNQLNPHLSIDEIRQKLEETARDLGDAGKDNTYGAGLLDAYRAVLLSGVPWLKEEPDKGTIAAGGTDKILVTFDSKDQELGKYYADIIVTSNDPVNEMLKVPVEMEVADTADDITPPWGSVIIESGAIYRNSRDVNLALTVNDDKSSATNIMMRFSTDSGSSYGEWEQFATGKAIQLASGDGTKTTHVQFKDEADNVSLAYRDDIVIDTTDPAGSIIIENGDEYTSKIELLLGLEASDSLSGVELMSFSGDGENFTDWEIYVTSAIYKVSGDGQKTIYVKYKDRAENTVTASDEIIVDTTGPEVTITSPADGSTSDDSTPVLSYTIEDAISQDITTYYVKVDGFIVGKRSGDELDTLDDGSHTLEVAAKDGCGNMAFASSDFTIDTGADTEPPSGYILIADGDLYTNVISVRLNLTATDNMSPENKIKMAFSEDGVSFAAWEQFYSTRQYIMQDGDGEKTIYVKFKDDIGNVSVPYSDSIILDTTAPVITMVSPEEGKYYDDTTPLLEYTVDDQGAALEIKLDGTSVTTRSGEELSELSEGWHTLLISAEDAAENIGLVTVIFRIDTQAPLVNIISPANTRMYNDTTPLLSYSIDDPKATVSIVLLDGEAVTTREGQELPELSEGEHSVEVKAEDELGRTGSGLSTFTIDTTAPAVSIVLPVNDSFTNDNTPILDYEVDDPKALIMVKLDEDWVGTRDGEELPQLAEGLHTVLVKAADEADNVSTATNKFTVDTILPAVTLIAPEDGGFIGEATPILLFEVVDEYETVITVKLDGEKIEIKSGEKLPELAFSDHTVEVEAKDPVGNIGSVINAFTVSKDAPLVVEIEVSTSPNYEGLADIYGDKVVWYEYRGSYYINMYDIITKEKTKIIDKGFNCSIDGDKVAYGDYYNVSVYDIITKESIKVSSQKSYSPAINGNRIIWHCYSNSNKNTDIYMYDLATEKETRITDYASMKYYHDIYGDKIAWRDDRNGGSIFVYDIPTEKETQLTDVSSHKNDVTIYKDKIAWTDNRNGYLYNIYMYDLSTEKETRLNTYHSWSPAMYEDKIVWGGLKDPENYDIRMYDFSLDKDIRITYHPKEQWRPKIHEDKIVWVDARHRVSQQDQNYDIYMARLVYFPEITSVDPTTVSVGDSFTVTGDGFGYDKWDDTKVLFANGVEALIESWSNDEIICRVPNGAKSGPLKVVNLRGESGTVEMTVTDQTPPTIVSASASGIATQVEVLFSEPVEKASAETASNYAIDKGITVTQASLGSDLKTVLLTTTELTGDTVYTLTVNNVKDRAEVPNTIAPDSQVTFKYSDVPTEGLIGYWKLDEGEGEAASDSSGNNNNGAVIGSAWTGSGKIDGALELDGSNDHVNVTMELGSTLTISAWAKSTVSSPSDMLWCIDSDNRGPDLFFASGKICLNTWDSANNPFCDIPSDLSEWHIYTTVIQDGNTKLYIDGALAGSATYKDPAGTVFHISSAAGYDWEGVIDDVRIYNRALTEEEVVRLAQYGKSPNVTISSPADGSATNDATPLLDYETETSATIKVTVDTEEVPTRDNEELAELSDGEHTVKVEASNVNGTGFATSTFTVDTAVPTVTIISPANGSTTTDNTPLLDYETEAGATIKVIVDTKEVTTRDNEELAELADGSHTIKVEATDAAGNTGSATSTFTVDATSPVVTITTPSDGDVVPSTPITVNGTLDDDSIAKVTINGKDYDVTVKAFEATDVALSEGENTITASATDAAGNTGSVSITVRLDSTPPNLVIIAPSEGDTVNVSPVLIRGLATDTAPGNLSVEVIGGKTYPVIRQGGEFYANATLASGANTVTLKAYDSIGNITEKSISITLDAKCDVYATYELGLVTTSSYTNPFKDVTFSWSLRAAGGGEAISQSGFYDGDGVFKVRFTPTAAGTHTFATTSNDADLDNITGSFEAQDTGRKGFVRVKDSHYFEFDSGSEHVPLADTLANLLNASTNDYESLIDHDKATGLNTVRLILFNAANDINYRTWAFGGTMDTPDYETYNVELFRKLDYIIAYLEAQEMLAEVILLSGNDSYIDKAKLQDYLTYAMKRLSAYANVTLTIAIDYKSGFSDTDIDDFAQTIENNDSVNNHILTVTSDDTFNFHDRSWADVITLRTNLDPTDRVEAHYAYDRPILTYLACEDSALAENTRDVSCASTDLVGHDSIAAFMRGGFGSYANVNSVNDNLLQGRVADKHLANFKDYVISLGSLTLLEPASNLADTGYMKRTAEKNEYLGYLPKGTASILVDMTESEGTFDVNWFEPDTNTSTFAGLVLAGENRAFDTPFTKASILQLETMMMGDVDRDRDVDIFDLFHGARAFGSVPEDSTWNPYADFDWDRDVDIRDLMTIAVNFGR